MIRMDSWSFLSKFLDSVEKYVVTTKARTGGEKEWYIHTCDHVLSRWSLRKGLINYVPTNNTRLHATWIKQNVLVLSGRVVVLSGRVVFFLLGSKRDSDGNNERQRTLLGPPQSWFGDKLLSSKARPFLGLETRKQTWVFPSLYKKPRAVRR